MTKDVNVVVDNGHILETKGVGMTRPTEEVIADTLEVLEVLLAINKVLNGDVTRISDLMHELRQILIDAVEENGDYHDNFIG